MNVFWNLPSETCHQENYHILKHRILFTTTCLDFKHYHFRNFASFFAWLRVVCCKCFNCPVHQFPNYCPCRCIRCCTCVKIWFPRVFGQIWCTFSNDWIHGFRSYEIFEWLHWSGFLFHTICFCKLYPCAKLFYFSILCYHFSLVKRISQWRIQFELYSTVTLCLLTTHWIHSCLETPKFSIYGFIPFLHFFLTSLSMSFSRSLSICSNFSAIYNSFSSVALAMVK